MRKMSAEMKVGIFVVLGLLVLAYMTVNIEKIRVGRAAGYKIHTMLNSAAGLVNNSPVRIAGVQVGRVEDIALEAGKAKVTLRLPAQTMLPIDSIAIVKSEGLLGERYIEIQPGVFKDVFVQPDDEIKQGVSMVDMDQLFTQLMSVAKDVKGVTRSLNTVLGGNEGELTIKKIFDNIEETTTNLNVTVKENRDRFNTVMINFETLSGELAGVSAKAGDTFATINKIAGRIDNGEGTLGRLLSDDSLYDSARDAMAGLKNIAGKIDNGEGTLGRLLSDESLYYQTRDMMASISKMTKKIERGEGTLGKLMTDDSLYKQASETMASLNKTAKRIERGEGTLGKLTTDESLYADTRKALKNANKAMEGLQEQFPITILGTVLSLGLF